MILDEMLLLTNYWFSYKQQGWGGVEDANIEISTSLVWK
jgi:hypothetical protein